ncbi:16S rRNA (cytidine(1402)-2'-O)-methyltransferase [Pontibacter sp. G13]|uniref:16S rRNA (cytidine(1402)-2'-O)-methyltransferase n=1 Tax=Pontibacter sp. G13 TaxID=3074898 RepID=UPI00288C411E|nr:16S rRNA (cytidine(1402)-2'-O)-methyltransferase [Pontibacter sp. G13]WNJ16267.1 16S rRNA (cytidine(1402)-2'-O)-methyltransferase [Pontibacter sp. G13]
MAAISLVPTPIGNLKDITLRALEVLQSADLIVAEDTRTTGILLKHYEIDKPLSSLHMHNEHRAVPKLLDRIQADDMHVAVVSDAGTPGISDPGFLLVREAIAREVPIDPLPGATAFVPALVGSGLPCDRFIFEGFLPQKKGRQTRILALVDEPRTMVFYESPHRLEKALTQFMEHFGADRQAAVVREISKLHQDYVRGTLEELVQHFAQHKAKGEIVMVVGGKPGK